MSFFLLNQLCFTILLLRIVRTSECELPVSFIHLIQVFATKIEQFPIECRKTQTKVTVLLWPITKHTHNPVNQSKLKANTCS